MDVVQWECQDTLSSRSEDVVELSERNIQPWLGTTPHNPATLASQVRATICSWSFADQHEKFWTQLTLTTGGGGVLISTDGDVNIILVNQRQQHASLQQRWSVDLIIDIIVTFIVTQNSLAQVLINKLRFAVNVMLLLYIEVSRNKL